MEAGTERGASPQQNAPLPRENGRLPKENRTEGLPGERLPKLHEAHPCEGRGSPSRTGGCPTLFGLGKFFLGIVYRGDDALEALLESHEVLSPRALDALQLAADLLL